MQDDQAFSATPDWAERLDEVMTRQRIGNAELERLSQVDRKRIGQYRAGKNVPPFTAMAAMARHLGVTCEWLATGLDAEPAYVADARALIHQPAPFTVHRIQIAELQLEEAMQASAVIPSEALRQALLTLLIRHDVPAQDIAAILLALKRPGDPVK